MTEKIILSSKDSEGNYYVSYSALKAFTEAKGFNTGRLGKEEFIRHYFFGEQYGDEQGWAQFGSNVEDYICKREGADNFTEDERKILDKIEPLGLFQQEIKIPFKGFYLKGFVDDQKLDRTKNRDYKTASLNSSKKYYEDDYKQLDIYALATYKELGLIPEMEVCVIERGGNPFRGEKLYVKENIWYIPRTTNEAKLAELEQYIIKTTEEISFLYQTFLKLNK